MIISFTIDISQQLNTLMIDLKEFHSTAYTIAHTIYSVPLNDKTGWIEMTITGQCHHSQHSMGKFVWFCSKY